MFTRALGIGSSCVAASALVVGLLLPLSGPVKVVPADPVQIANGPVQGIRADGLTTYRGIPYASPLLTTRLPAPL